MASVCDVSRDLPLIWCRLIMRLSLASFATAATAIRTHVAYNSRRLSCLFRLFRTKTPRFIRRFTRPLSFVRLLLLLRTPCFIRLASYALLHTPHSHALFHTAPAQALLQTPHSYACIASYGVDTRLFHTLRTLSVEDKKYTTFCAAFMLTYTHVF
jgi:hypothetical protein